jgi:lysophospholipase L1-like esterase
VSRPAPRWSAVTVTVAIVILLGVAVARGDAQATSPDPPVEVHFFAADTSQAGVVSLFFFGAFGAPVTFFERVGDRLQRLGTQASPTDPTGLTDAVNWRCDRRVRRFTASAVLAGGRFALGAYSVHTPSCATRLELGVPRRLAAGAVGRIRIVDRWGNGGVTAQLCVTPPAAPRTCGDERLRRAISVVTRRLRATTSGRWRVELRFRGHRVRRSIAVGAGVGATAPPPTVLTTGDSTMQGIDTFLADELGDAAKVRSDVRPGTGISKPLGPWATLARTQTEHLRQAATVVSLGVADGFPLRARDGTRQECCGAAWIAEYTRRVRAMMKTYLRHGRARVLWLTLPIPKGPREVTDAVNRSVLQAAEGLAGVSVLRMDLVFTPDGFRDVMPYRGRPVDVREEDGIHLNIAGTAIAAKIVAAALRKR